MSATPNGSAVMIAINPERAASPLGKVLARLLQVAGLEIDLDEFGAIDEIAEKLTELEINDKNLHEWIEQVEATAEEAETVAEQAATDIKSLESRFDSAA